MSREPASRTADLVRAVLAKSAHTASTISNNSSRREEVRHLVMMTGPHANASSRQLARLRARMIRLKTTLPFKRRCNNTSSRCVRSKSRDQFAQ